jgi:tetratricopeptide (TPR) repeat protein
MAAIAEKPEATPQHRATYAMALIAHAHRLAYLNQFDAAKPVEEQGLAVIHALKDDFPDRTGFGELDYWAYNLIACGREVGGRDVDAIEWHTKSLEIGEELTDRFPLVSRFGLNLMVSNQLLADHYAVQQKALPSGVRYDRIREMITEGIPLRAAIGDPDTRLPPMFANQAARWLASCPDPRFRDPGRALSLAPHFAQSRPPQGAYQITLGIAHYHAGDYKQALSALDDAERLKVTFPRDRLPVGFYRAMTFAKLGDAPAARREYDRALAELRRSRHWFLQHRLLAAEAASVLALPAPTGMTVAP